MAAYYKCDNCEYETDLIIDLKPFKDFFSRVTMGKRTVIPAGDCPECGAFCYMHKRYYNHAFTIAFTVVSTHDSGNITTNEFKQGLNRRMRMLEKNRDELEVVAHCDLPYDTYPTGHEEFVQWENE